MTLKQSVCHKVMRTFPKPTDALQPKGSPAEPALGWLRLEHATASTPAPHLAQPNVPALGTEAHSGHAEQCQQSKITCVFFLFNDSLMY